MSADKKNIPIPGTSIVVGAHHRPGVCQHEGCKASHPTHKWGNIKAHGEGWYMMRDGREWCPNHRPAWAPSLTAGTEDTDGDR